MTETEFNAVSSTDRPSPEESDEGAQLSTGLSELDKKLDGGIPAGQIVTVLYPADSAGEILGFKLATEATHPVIYLTTCRSPDRVFQDIANSRGGLETDIENPQVAQLAPSEFALEDDRSETNSSSEGNECASVNLPTVLDQLERSEESPVVVLDSLSDCLATETPQHVTQAVRRLAEQIKEAGGVAYLFLHDSNRRPLSDGARRICHLSDGVFKYQPASVLENTNTDQLAVTKLRNLARGANSLPLQIPLNVDRTISISREQRHG